MAMTTAVSNITALHPPRPRSEQLRSPRQHRSNDHFIAPRRERVLHLVQQSFLFGTYRIATAPEAYSKRLTSFRSRGFDRPANNAGPRPTILGCTTNSYSSMSPSSASAFGSVRPPVSRPL